MLQYFKTRDAIRRRRAEKDASWMAYRKMFNRGRTPPLDTQDAIDQLLRERRDLAYLGFAAKRRTLGEPKAIDAMQFQLKATEIMRLQMTEELARNLANLLETEDELHAAVRERDKISDRGSRAYEAANKKVRACQGGVLGAASRITTDLRAVLRPKDPSSRQAKSSSG
jgi:hypothetical protein